MANDNQKRAADMKAGPNTIVEDPKAPKSRPDKFIPTAAPLPAVPGRELEACPLTHFLAVDFGKKVDQCAGFAHHAKGLGPRTIPEWRAEFAKFMAKPIRSLRS